MDRNFYEFWGQMFLNLAKGQKQIVAACPYGAISWISGGNHRQAMLFTGVFFVAGLLLLAAVNVRRGRAAALAADGADA